MVRCAFCRRRAAGVFATTVSEGPPEDVNSWRRGLAPLCARCRRLLAEAGDQGRRLEGTGQRWFIGHTVGRFASPVAPGAVL